VPFERKLVILEMVELNTSEIIYFGAGRLSAYIGSSLDSGDTQMRLALEHVHRICNRVGWTDIAAQAARLIARIEVEENQDVLSALLQELDDAIDTKSIGLHAVIVEDRDAGLFANAVGNLCDGALHPDLAITEEEFNLSGRCAALGLSTASVAHSMRAVEASLHVLCGALGITFPGSIELQDWRALTDKIRAEIASWDNKPRTQEKSEQLKTLGELLIPADGFRLAWRNHVAHARDKYEDAEARSVLRYVADFLRRLSNCLIIKP